MATRPVVSSRWLRLLSAQPLLLAAFLCSALPAPLPTSASKKWEFRFVSALGASPVLMGRWKWSDQEELLLIMRNSRLQTTQLDESVELQCLLGSETCLF